MKKKILMGLILVSVGLLTGCFNQKTPEIKKYSDYDDLMDNLKKDTEDEKLTCWYAEQSDKDWLSDLAKKFQKEYGIEVELVHYDGVSLFEDMNRANLDGSGPDVYFCENDQLELARNSGMAVANENLDADFLKKYYPDTAINAISFQGKTYGYPVYFDTYCFVYDKELLQSAPASMEDILAFSDDYSDTGLTKAILRWDVSDPYINTMFLAANANIFGENGDDASQFEIVNDQTVAAMKYFNSISEYMWMDKSNISHDIVKQRIEDNTLIMGLCKSDILSVVNNEDSTYQITYVPSLTKDMASKPYSTTYIAMVNPYGKENIGNMFAAYVSIKHPELRYEGNGKLPVINQKDGFDEKQSIIYAQYLNSTPVPKVMILGDYMNESAIAFDAIWEGKDVETQLSSLQERMDAIIKEN